MGSEGRVAGGWVGGKSGRKGGFFRVTHLDRYATRQAPDAGTNPNPCRGLKQLMGPLIGRGSGIKVKDVCKAAGTTATALVRADGYRGPAFGEDWICLHYACGKCPFHGCANAHLWENEMPAGLASSVQRKLEAAVWRLREDSGQDRRPDGPPTKRARNAGWTPPNGLPPNGHRWEPPSRDGRYGPAGGRRH